MEPEKKKRVYKTSQLKPFVKGDPRINRKGAPKKLPILKELMRELLGSDNDDITQSEAAHVVKALIETAKSKKGASVLAAKEILDRAFGKVKDEVEVNQTVNWVETKNYEGKPDDKEKKGKKS